jgi:hypothetical protein
MTVASEQLGEGGHMATAAGPKRVATPATARSATGVAVAVLGMLIALAGVEHGVGEILQGPVRPNGPLIMSWPDATALEILSGEPALTVIPNLLVTGILAVVVGLALAARSIWLARRRYRGPVLIGLSILLLLVGGGLVPPLMGVIVGAVAGRIGTASRRHPGRFARGIEPLWAWFLAAAVLGYLGLMPGMILASTWGVASEALVIGLAAFAFANFGLALAAARAHDRLHATTR